ncbi:MAG: DUF721 domain-containing protein [Deltaproteobacteria bacterium]
MINKRGKNEEKISDTLGNFVKQDKIKSRYHETGINKIWKDLMGEMVNNYTRSIKISGTKMIVMITSAPLKHELSYNKEKLIELINEKIGYKYVDEIIIR